MLPGWLTGRFLECLFLESKTFNVYCLLLSKKTTDDQMAEKPSPVVIKISDQNKTWPCGYKNIRVSFISCLKESCLFN